MWMPCGASKEEEGSDFERGDYFTIHRPPSTIHPERDSNLILLRGRDLGPNQNLQPILVHGGRTVYIHSTSAASAGWFPLNLLSDALYAYPTQRSPSTPIPDLPIPDLLCFTVPSSIGPAISQEGASNASPILFRQSRGGRTCSSRQGVSPKQLEQRMLSGQSSLSGRGRVFPKSRSTVIHTDGPC